MSSLSEKTIEQKISFARSSGAWSAWAELLRRFDYKQRQHLANLLAHEWTIKELTIEPHYGSSSDTITANIAKDKASFPSRGEEDPKLSDLDDTEKTIVSLMAENQRLRSQANSSEMSLKSLEEDVSQLVAKLQETLKESSGNSDNALELIAQFKESYFL